MRKNRTIGFKLVLGAVALCLVVLVVGGTSAALIAHLRNQIDLTVNQAGTRDQLSNDIARASLEMATVEQALMLRSILQQQSAIEKYKVDFGAASARMESDLNEFSAVAQTDENRRTLGALREQLGLLQGAHREMLQYLDKQQFDQVQKTFDERILPQAQEVSRRADAFARQQRETATASARSAMTAAASGQWVVLGLVCIALVIALGVVVVVRQVTGQLRHLAADMSRMSDQVASAASQVSASSQSVAQAASEQAASLEETSATGEELASMTKRNLEGCRSADEQVSVADQQVAGANQTLEQMVASMREINSSSSKIGKIIKVIDEIAFQTNILALNAAVEAARAGEAGMGFAVVADEVRNLAQRCATAAKDTSALIEESIATSNEGSRKLELVVSAIYAITESASKVKALVSEVNEGSNRQSRSIEQISAAVAQMQRVTQNTAASAEESASASEEMSAQAEAMQDAVQQLQEVVGRDGAEPARFRHRQPALQRAAAPMAPRRLVAVRSERPADVAAANGHHHPDSQLEEEFSSKW